MSRERATPAPTGLKFTQILSISRQRNCLAVFQISGHFLYPLKKYLQKIYIQLLKNRPSTINYSIIGAQAQIFVFFLPFAHKKGVFSFVKY